MDVSTKILQALKRFIHAAAFELIMFLGRDNTYNTQTDLQLLPSLIIAYTENIIHTISNFI